jgi:hypothetical protein
MLIGDRAVFHFERARATFLGICVNHFEERDSRKSEEKNAIAKIGKRLTAKKYSHRRVLNFAPSSSARRSRASLSQIAQQNESENDQRDKVERGKRV